MRYLMLTVFLAACSVQPPDVPVFENMQQRLSVDPKTGHLILSPSPTCMAQIKEVECGHGVYVVSGKQIFVGENKANWFNNKPWSQLKAESVYVPAQESYAPIATYIINSCKKMNCEDSVTGFKVRLGSLDAVSTTPVQ